MQGFIFSLSIIPKVLPFTYFIKKEKKDLGGQREHFLSFIYIVTTLLRKNVVISLRFVIKTSLMEEPCYCATLHNEETQQKGKLQCD